MNIVRIVICDDEKLFLQQFYHTLEYVLCTHQQTAEIICVTSGKELFLELEKQSADVIFLDIEMPDEDGFSIAKRLSKLKDKPLLVFITNIETLVFESFEHEPIWYLLKRNIEQLPTVINKIIDKLDHTEKYFEISTSNTQYRISLSDILYLESKDHYITVYTQDETYRFRGKLNDIECQMDRRHFVRCHASYFVNCQHIKALGKGKILLVDNTSIPISRNRLDATQETFMNYKESLRL